MKAPRVLVAEDEAIIALDLQKTLKKWGYNVEATFKKGEDLLKFAQADDPEILIMDIFLAGHLDGISTAREVLKTNKVPVIFMTGAAQPQYAKNIDIGGKYEYLQKPVSKEKLKNALNKLCPRTNIE